MKQYLIILVFIGIPFSVFSQNSMIGDGFGGRLWYTPTNYTVGSYSAYSICYDICGAGDTQLYGWGSNITNQLGLGFSVFGTAVPLPIPNTTGVRYFSTGYIMGAIKFDGTGWAWGSFITGSPVQVITDAYFLDASSTTISFVKNDGTVWSIGENYGGNFGDGTTTGNYINVVQMQNITDAVRVANNSMATIVLLSDSTLMAAGSDSGFGVLGIGPGDQVSLTPTAITSIDRIIDIKSTAFGTIALKSDGKVYQWGMDPANWTGAETPFLITQLNGIVAISGCDDGYHYMALDSLGNCYAWGDNSMGQCGFSGSAAIPTVVATNVIDIMAGETFSYIVKSDGTLWGTGMSNGSSIWLDLPDIQRNYFAQMHPQQVPGACELVNITTTAVSCTDSTFGSITVDNFGGTPPFQYSIGGPYQTGNVFTGLGPGTYTITVQDANGCEYSAVDSITGSNCQPGITIINASIDFPNVFSPNNDSENDVFLFPNSGVEEFRCRIYDRWGLLMYDWTNPLTGWNGKNLNAKDCPEGTYYYILDYKLVTTEPLSKAGHVTLLR